MSSSAHQVTLSNLRDMIVDWRLLCKLAGDQPFPTVKL